MKLLVKTLLIMLTLTLSTVFGANVAVETGYYNKYLGFGSGGVLHNGSVVQSSLTVNFDDGLYVSLWNSFSPDGRYNLGDEIDYKVGWTGKVSQNWSTDISLIYFDEPSFTKFGSGDIWYVSMTNSRPIGDYTLNVKTRCYTPVGGSKFEGGWLIGPSISRNFNINSRLSLFCDVGVNYDDGGFGMDNGLIFTAFTSLNLKVTNCFSWNVVQATLYIPINVSDSRKNDVVWGSGVKIQF